VVLLGKQARRARRETNVFPRALAGSHRHHVARARQRVVTSRILNAVCTGRLNVWPQRRLAPPRRCRMGKSGQRKKMGKKVYSPPRRPLAGVEAKSTLAARRNRGICTLQHDDMHAASDHGSGQPHVSRLFAHGRRSARRQLVVVKAQPACRWREGGMRAL
jgi:hypothetical protein